MECGGVMTLRLLGQVESYLSILLLNQDVKIIFPGSKQSLVWRDICSMVTNQVSVLEEKEG